MDFNELTLTGRLGKDPEMKALPSGALVCEFSVASGYVVKGEKKTEWTTCRAWNKTAELADQYLRKGSRVLVSGRKITREWVDSTGGKRYVVELMVDRLVFLDSAKSADGYQKETVISRPAPSRQAPRPQAQPSASGAQEYDDEIQF